jgi:biopolymer transport protein TolR
MNVRARDCGSIRSEMNVVPLIDLVLVLLVLFILVTPVTQMGYGVTSPAPVACFPDSREQLLVVYLDRLGATYLNREKVADHLLPGKLREFFGESRRQVVYFAGDDNVGYDRVLAVLSLVRESGATNLGIVFNDLPVR